LSYLRAAVTRLGTSDLEGVLAFLGEANSLDGPEPFPRPLLASLRRLVPSDSVTYCELDRVRKIPIWAEDEGAVVDEGPGIETYWRLRHQHPVCHFEDMNGDFRAMKISDFVSRAELRRREIFWEYLRPWGIEYEISVGLDAPLSHTKVFMFGRADGRDFTERDRGVLDLLRPHLAKIYETAKVRRTAREALALLQRTHAALVVLEGADRVAYATPEAQRLLALYFRSSGSSLPHKVEEWLREQRQALSPEPLTVEKGEESVVVHFVEGSLLLEEQREASRLTERESEIVDLVAAGKTNAEIAEALWIAPGTVRKHLENVYEKLEVHSRTAAVAKLRSGSGAPRA
jgi:DNA-binding CsgD family transcriptional regulator